MRKILTISLLILAPIIGFSQQSLEFTAGFGFTAVDIEGLVEVDEIENTVAEDWDQFSGSLGGQFFFASKGNIGIGAELMYQYLYWYSVRVPYAPHPIYREYSVEALRITPILRFELDKQFALDIGPEFNFSDGLSLGLLISGNYSIRISEKIEIPVKARLDIIDFPVIIMPITINAGVRIMLDN